MITSKDNEKIKYLRKLGQKKHRDKSGQFLVENLVIVYDAVRAGFAPQDLFVTRGLVENCDEKLAYILEKVPGHVVIDDKVNKAFSSLDTPSGICAVYDKLDTDIKLEGKILYLNAISDPGNLGTILRTCVAFGVQNVVVDGECADLYNPKTIHASKDAIFKLNIGEDKDLEVFDDIKSKMKVYATHVADGKEIRDISQEENCGIVFGNESHGVSQGILDRVDDFINIKSSEKIESLNVGVAVGVVLGVLYDN